MFVWWLDHVFVCAPWSFREGEAYLVGRVMEFLPPPSDKSVIKNQANNYQPDANHEPRLRVNYYLRPRDISNR